MRYGVPYKGSKNKLAKRIIARIPTSDIFVDLFAGGCAVSHAALESGRYKKVVLNDFNGMGIDLFVKSLRGDFDKENRWLDRKYFFDNLNKDSYSSLIWCFGGDGRTYLYAECLEPWKKAMHYAKVFKDYSLLREIGISGNLSKRDVREHGDEYRKIYLNYLKKNGMELNEKDSEKILSGCGFFINEEMRRLKAIQRIKHPSYLSKIKCFKCDYAEVKIDPNALVYCDIPYYGTSGYFGQDFDFQRFFDWASKQPNRMILSSYEAPDDWEIIDEFKHVCSIQSGCVPVTERIFARKKDFKNCLRMVPFF